MSYCGKCSEMNPFIFDMILFQIVQGAECHHVQKEMTGKHFLLQFQSFLCVERYVEMQFSSCLFRSWNGPFHF